MAHLNWQEVRGPPLAAARSVGQCCDCTSRGGCRWGPRPQPIQGPGRPAQGLGGALEPGDVAVLVQGLQAQMMAEPPDQAADSRSPRGGNSPMG